MTVSVDTGGTFTDVVLRWANRVVIHKTASTPDDPAAAVLAGIDAVLDELRSGPMPPDLLPPTVIHGSTVATTALLEGRGARVAFLTTAGFEDTLHIARQNRPALYAQVARRPDPPVRRVDCVGVNERMGPDGRVLTPLDPSALEAAIAQIGPVEAVAVSLLHSYANPDHERRVGAAVRARLPGVHLTLSSELLPEFREYERAATTVANAVVAPRMGDYVGRLQEALGPRLRVMSSSGGSLTADETRAQPVHTVLSGPAGGVVGALAAGRAAGVTRLLTFDMGGTSTDVALCDGGLGLSRSATVAGLPLRVPTIDIHTVGAGGGSVAWVDDGGALRVGPRSAGAVPGPACYGRGGAEPTVTDANVVLGRLDPVAFLGGEMALDAHRAHAAVARIATRLGVELKEAAEGIVQVAEATMARALKVISVERGHDARDFSLVTFGGAGGLHACALARELGITSVIVPPRPGLLSAVGMHHAPAVYTQSRAVMRTVDSVALPADMLARAHARLDSQGFEAADRRMIWTADLRYAGQSHEIEVSATDAIRAFHDAHERLYGYRTGRPVECVAVRLRAEGLHAPPAFPVAAGDQRRIAGTVARACLAVGAAGRGPALVTEYSSTTWIPPGWAAVVHASGAILLRETRP